MKILLLLFFCWFVQLGVVANERVEVIDTYIEPKILKPIPVFPVSKINQYNKRATEADMRIIKQYYRHSNITDKVIGGNYLSLSFVYTLPSKVANASKGLAANPLAENLTNAIIANFNENHANNVTLNKRNFGLSLAFGSQISKNVKREFELLFYQAAYIYNQNNPAQPTNDANANRLIINYNLNGTDVVAAFDNAEYLKRNISLHYNLQRDFNNLFGEAKFTPFVAAGLGLSSRVTMIRTSIGILGNGNEVNNVITKVNYWNIMPSFGLAAGLRYNINETFAVNFKVNTIQVVNNIDFGSNYAVQLGGMIFF